MTDNQYGGSKKTIVRLRLGFHCQLRLAELEQSFIQGSLPIDQIRDDFERVVWPNAKAMRAWCVGQAKHDVRAAILCSKLAGCAGYLLDQEHGRQLLIQWREDAVEAIAGYLPEGRLPAETHADLVHDLLGHLSYLGYLHMTNGDMAKARATLERTIREGLTYGDQSAAGVAHLHLAMVAIREEAPGRAEADLRQALAVADGNRSLMAASHNLLGVVVSDRGMDREAVTEYEEAARLFEELNDRSGAATVYANRCGSLLNLGRIDEAKQDLERAEAIGVTLGSVQLRGLVQVNWARLLWVTQGASREQIISKLESARADFLQTGDKSQVRRVEKILEELAGSSSTDGDETPPAGSVE